jgi:tRNA(Arg) A34 adenosine deaminase TadA
MYWQRRAAMSAYDRVQAEKFMRHAIELGRKGMEAGSGGPFGAIVVKNGEIIGEGWNRVLSTNDPTAHGEIVAIRDASKHLQSYDLSGCELYTSGEPCPMCLSAIYWAHLDRVFYGFNIQAAAEALFDDELIFTELNKPQSQRKIPEIQILEAEALTVLRNYAANPERAKY